MPGQGLLTTPESSSAPIGALVVFAPFASDSSKLGRRFWAQKNPKRVLGAFWGWRSEADSNRCSSFCRAEPSHSAIGPFPKWRTTVGLRIYESGFTKVSLLGDKFRKDAYNAGDEGLMGWVRFAT